MKIKIITMFYGQVDGVKRVLNFMRDPKLAHILVNFVFVLF